MNDRLRELKKKFNIKSFISACLLGLLIGLFHITTGWLAVILGICILALVWAYIAPLYYKAGCDETREISMIQNLYRDYIGDPDKTEELEDGTLKLTYKYEKDFDNFGLYNICFNLSPSNGINNWYNVKTIDKFTDAENGNVIMYAKKFEKQEIKLIKDDERQSI